MTAFLYGENIFRWTDRLGGNGLSSIENKVKVEKEGQGGGKAEEKGGGVQFCAKRYTVQDPLTFGQVKPRLISHQRKD